MLPGRNIPFMGALSLLMIPFFYRYASSCFSYANLSCIYLLIWQKRSLTHVMMAGAVIAVLPIIGLFLYCKTKWLKA
ncbi:hypothetical protein CEE34_03505 [Candidatus Aerophobetes bacterium Ae_b3a]|nr:MAG: hypothetical protein CEE34_03505 [Candidatus Aerophobetes bacterium Ae_b3a]